MLDMTEKVLAERALAAMAIRLRKDSKSRKWTGPQFAGIRLAFRTDADKYQALAHKLADELDEYAARKF